MILDETLFEPAEKYAYTLRALYDRAGYRKYAMSKFEEYELYSRNKDFLISDHVITFTDTDGKLMALKPDVTLSIVKSTEDRPGTLQKLYYTENVFRVGKRTNTFRELLQTGLECIGAVDASCVREVLDLAGRSLDAASPGAVLELSHLGILSRCLDALTGSREVKDRLLQCVDEKNVHGIRAVAAEQGLDPDLTETLAALVSLNGTAEEVMPRLTALCETFSAAEERAFLEEALSGARTSGAQFRLNFSLTGDMGYYTGLIFKGFVPGVLESVLSGGQYDGLMRRMGKASRAIGFAVYLDHLNDSGVLEKPAGKQLLSVALPKGRLGTKVYMMFEKAGFGCPEILSDSRKLIFENEAAGIRISLVKPTDVARYVERGAADIGVVGKDILNEESPDVYELLDLRTGICRMAVAGPAGFTDGLNRPLRVATKYENCAKEYYRGKGRDIDLIRLNGSIEIAPLLGLSDVIVDIVETGTTLRENHLEVLEEIFPISARLIANKASYSFRGAEIDRVRAGIAAAAAEDRREA